MNKIQEEIKAQNKYINRSLHIAKEALSKEFKNNSERDVIIKTAFNRLNDAVLSIQKVRYLKIFE